MHLFAVFSTFAAERSRKEVDVITVPDSATTVVSVDCAGATYITHTHTLFNVVVLVYMDVYPVYVLLLLDPRAQD